MRKRTLAFADGSIRANKYRAVNGLQSFKEEL